MADIADLAFLHLEEDEEGQGIHFGSETLDPSPFCPPSSFFEDDGETLVQRRDFSDDELEELEDGDLPLDELEVIMFLSANNVALSRPIEIEEGGDSRIPWVYEIFLGQFAGHNSAIWASPPAAKSVVDNLPSIFLTKEDLEKNNAVCAICTDEISLEEKVKQLPCLHLYHGECIFPWLRMRNTCPVCRYELPTDDADCRVGMLEGSEGAR